MIRAALFDIGGVLTESPFQAFARYETERGLPQDFVRTLNATNPDTNAWARLERSEVSVREFADLYEAEARAAGHEIDALEVLALLGGALRPEMLLAVRRCREAGLVTAALTNNFASSGDRGQGTFGGGELGHLFDRVLESSRLGVRKPDPRFYELACRELEIEPREAVFLDDLGVNLKPARRMGMVTIKVVDAARAIEELEAVVGIPLS